MQSDLQPPAKIRVPSTPCSILAASGKPCKVKATRAGADGRPFCHLHDPNGKAAQVRQETHEAAKAGDLVEVAERATAGQSGPLLVSVRTAARMLSVSERTVWAMIASDELRSVRVRYRVLVPIHLIHALVGINPTDGAGA